MENTIVSNDVMKGNDIAEAIRDGAELLQTGSAVNPKTAITAVAGVAIVASVGIITYKVIKNIVAIVKAKKEQKKLKDQEPELDVTEDTCDDECAE